MSKRHTLLKGSSVLLIALATGCATTLPGTNTGIAGAGPSLNGSGLIANNAGGLISNNAGGLISNNAGGLISNNAGGLISNNAGGLISNNAGGLISNNAGGLTGTASGPGAGLISNNAGGLISNNAGGLISNNAGGLISNNAGGLISNNAGGYKVLDATASNTQPVAGARCAVFNERGEQISYSWTTTDANGHYSFSRLKPSGPVLFVKIVYESEGQEVTLMATTPAPRKAGTLNADVTPATTLVAKKIEQMVVLRAVNVASVQQSTVDKMVQTLAPALTPKGIVAAAILSDASVAKTFDAMLTAAPNVGKALDSVASNAGLTTLVEATPAQIQPNVPPVVTPPASSSNGSGGGSNPTPTPTPTPTSGTDTTPTPAPATVLALGAINSGSGVVADGSSLYAPSSSGNQVASLSSLTTAPSFAADATTPAGARAIAFSGGVEYALVGDEIVGGGNSVTDPALNNATSFAVVNGAAYVTDSTDNCLYKADLAAGTLSAFAGVSSTNGGHADGTGNQATFHAPSGITSANGFLYVADSGNNEIRQVSLTGDVTTFAGNASVSPGQLDGKGGLAHFDDPSGITADAAGNLYVADTADNAIRKIDASGNTTSYKSSSPVSLPASIAYTTLGGTPVLFVGTLNNNALILSGF